MDKKSFFRGFGVGVLFAAVILGISFAIRTSDAFVKKRAVELGMSYQEKESGTVLASDSSSAPPAVPEVSVEPVSTAEPKQKEKAAETPETSTGKNVKTTEEKQTDQKKSSSKSNEADMKKEKEKLEKNVKNEQKKLTISAGEWSTAVSNKLKKMGIIDDAKEFDKYLDKNGFSSSISAGTYQVSVDDTYRELAKKITGK